MLYPRARLDAYLELATHGIFALAGVTFVALFFIVAPYGRHERRGWGPTLSPRLAWVLMETPAVLLFAAVFFAGRHRAELVPLVLFFVWQLHYVHRTYVFPFRLPSTSKRMPVLVMLLGLTFQTVNSWINARWISELGTYETSWLMEPRFVGGALLFAVGITINLRADYALLRMKRDSEGYVLPRGGLFDYVVSPNYFGELLEWIGWALMAWSLPALAFAVYTFANLAPRAIAHRRWYIEKFEDFPRARRAIIPFIL